RPVGGAPISSPSLVPRAVQRTTHVLSFATTSSIVIVMSDIAVRYVRAFSFCPSTPLTSPGPAGSWLTTSAAQISSKTAKSPPFQPASSNRLDFAAQSSADTRHLLTLVAIDSSTVFPPGTGCKGIHQHDGARGCHPDHGSWFHHPRSLSLNTAMAPPQRGERAPRER